MHSFYETLPLPTMEEPHGKKMWTVSCALDSLPAVRHLPTVHTIHLHAVRTHMQVVCKTIHMYSNAVVNTIPVISTYLHDSQVDLPD